MKKESFVKIFDRDIEKLKAEILQFEKEEDLWFIAGDVKNSAGNLALHLCGNLKHYIGHVLGGTNYVREREKEFSLKNVPKSEIIKNIDEAKSIVYSTLSSIDETKLSEIYTEKFSLGEVETESALVHLVAHLSYHLGQINYLRRLMIS
jgi:hypothetical protein